MNEKIETLWRARYPIIWVVSFEEHRVIKALESMGAKTQVPLYIWRFGAGFCDVRWEKVQDAPSPVDAINFAVSGDKEPGLFVFLDFHPYLNSLEHPIVVRKLRDAARMLSETGNTIVLVGPVLRIPDELQKDVAVVDFPLPTEAEIRGMLVPAAASAGQVLGSQVEEEMIKACLGLTSTEVNNALAKSLAAHKRLLATEILAEKEQVVRKSGVLELQSTLTPVEDVGGLDLLMGWLRSRKAAFFGKARTYGLPYPRGVVLAGVPGCGKSLSARVIPSLWGLPLLRLDVGSLYTKWQGESEGRVREMIRLAEAVAPCVVWLDEMEKALSGIQSSGQTDSGTTGRMASTLLSWLSDKTAAVFVVATVNDVQSLTRNAELLRKGRFDDVFFVDLPVAEERLAIWTIHLRKRNRSPDAFGLDALVKETEGFSGAEIEAVLLDAMFRAFSDSEREVATADILASVQATVPLSRAFPQRVEEVRQWGREHARPATSRAQGAKGNVADRFAAVAGV